MSNKTLGPYKGFVGSVEFDVDDNILYGRILFIEDIITYEGSTPAELNAAFTESVDEYLEFCTQQQLPPNKPCSGNLNVRLGAELHAKANIAARLKNTSLNAFIVHCVQVELSRDDMLSLDNRIEGLKSAVTTFGQHISTAGWQMVSMTDSETKVIGTGRGYS